MTKLRQGTSSWRSFLIRAILLTRVFLLAARNRHDDLNAVAWAEWRLQIFCVVLIDENLDVLANLVLLIDHAKADAGELTFEIGKEFGERRASCSDDICPGV